MRSGYDTDITELLEECKRYERDKSTRAVFLSDWDVSTDLKSPDLGLRIQDDHLRNYFFLTDDDGHRNVFKRYASESFGLSLDCEEFLIAPNGTAALSLALQAFRDKGMTRLLVVTPTYFTILEKVGQVGFDVVEFPLTLNDSFFFDLQAFEHELESNRIDAVVLTLPYFGTGVTASTLLLEAIVSTCKAHDAWLLVDYLYGGMPWDNLHVEDYVFDHVTFSIVRSYEKTVYVESISKRLFMNGCKIALVFSCPELITRISNLSLFETGSMCGMQIQAYEKLYSPVNTKTISASIQRAVKKAESQYGRLVSMLLDFPECVMSDCTCGYFALLGIPCQGHDDMEYAKYLIKERGLATTPHSRYLHNVPGCYCFRVNLLLPSDIFLEGLKSLRDLLSSRQSLLR